MNISAPRALRVSGFAVPVFKQAIVGKNAFCPRKRHSPQDGMLEKTPKLRIMRPEDVGLTEPTS